MGNIRHLDYTTAMIVIAVLIYAIVRQLTAKPVKRIGFILFPLLAIYEAYESFSVAAVSKYQIIECAVMLTLAFIAAVIQAFNTDVFYKDGRLYMRSKIIAVATWIVYFLVRFGMRVVFSNTAQWTMWLGIAMTFSTRSVILYIKHPEIGQALSRQSHRHRGQY